MFNDILLRMSIIGCMVIVNIIPLVYADQTVTSFECGKNSAISSYSNVTRNFDCVLLKSTTYQLVCDFQFLICWHSHIEVIEN
jgi:hypothetical protein